MSVAICVITCRRRAGLDQLLGSLAALELPAQDVSALVVVDNDAGESARAVVDAWTDRMPWPLIYACESRAGIPFARNRAIREAGDCDFVAFIDDDQIASPSWIASALAKAVAAGADVVLGPVEFCLQGQAPSWYQLPQLPTYADGAAMTPAALRTNGVLLRRRALQGIEGPFDERDVHSGGTDSKLGLQLEQRGATGVWAAAARTTEFVPAERVTLRWLVARQFRNGSNRARMEVELVSRRKTWHTRGRRAMVQLAFGPVDAGRLLMRGQWRQALRLAESSAYSLGVIAGLFGLRHDEYAARHQPPPQSSGGQG